MENRNIATIGERLKVLRAEAGLTQGELAEAFFLANKSVISAYETGKRDVPICVLVKYSEKFQVSTDWILQGFVEKHSESGGKAKSAIFGFHELAEIYKNLGDPQLQRVALSQMKALIELKK